MIKSIYIDNFKVLNDFSLDLNPLTVLIGSNGSGKSTILQAVDLVCCFARLEIDTYVKERNWAAADLQSHLSSKRQMTFRTLFELQVDSEIEEIEWEIVLELQKEKGLIELNKEIIISKTKDIVLLRVDSGGFERYNWEKETMEKFPPLKLAGSLLKTIDIEKDGKTFPGLTALKKFALGSDSFELLSPERMRRSSRQEADSIGAGGERLAGFIHNLSKQKRENLKKRLKKYVPFIEGIAAGVEGSSDRVEMSVAEIFKGMDKPALIKAVHSSDGILRMIAISALAEIEKETGVILLDEIEDGINPYLTANLVKDLEEISRENLRQVIVTTHSSVVLDYFPAESIVFLWRDRNGAVHGSNLFSSDEIKASLEYMHPGEVWINMKEEEIIEKLKNKK